jgi:predicted DsbA family dithiol-disulfide isomerase
VNTLTAHRLLRLAEQEYGAEAQRELAEKLFEAHFEEGGDIGDPGELTALAVEVGLDPRRVAAYLASDEGLAETKAEIAAARDLGITAVPTFVIDEQYAVQGAQPPEIFLQVLGQARHPGYDTLGPTRRASYDTTGRDVPGQARHAGYDTTGHDVTDGRLMSDK